MRLRVDLLPTPPDRGAVILIDQCDEVPVLESGQSDERLYRFRSRRP